MSACGCPGIGRAKLPLSRNPGTDARLGGSLALPETVDSSMSNFRAPSSASQKTDNERNARYTETRNSEMAGT